VISMRRVSLGAGYRYLVESVAVGDGAPQRPDTLPLRRVRDPTGPVPRIGPRWSRRRAGCCGGERGDRGAPVLDARNVLRSAHR
jgi:hypothetical protein